MFNCPIISADVLRTTIVTLVFTVTLYDPKLNANFILQQRGEYFATDEEQYS